MAAPTIYHNPNCSTSRHALELLRARGHAPKIVRYMDDTPEAAALAAILKKMKAPADAILRTRGVEAADLEAFRTAKDDAAKAKRLSANPKMIERPIVVHGSKAALIRPKAEAEAILDALGL